MQAFQLRTLGALTFTLVGLFACGEPSVIEPDGVGSDVATQDADSGTERGDGGLAPALWTETLSGASEGWLMNVHALTHDERYAVGGTLETGHVLRFDGARWSREEIGAEVQLLNWVTRPSADTLVAVGRGGAALHREAGQWRRVETPTTQTLWGVWGSAEDDLWAVGGDGFASEDKRGVVLRFDGVAWAQIEVPQLEEEVFAWFKVWGAGPDDVYIVGQRGALLHFDGEGFEEIELGLDEDLIAVWGTDAEHVAVVGGRNNGVVARFDGEAWLTRELAPMPGLNGVWIRDASVLHVGGNYGTVATLNFASLETIEELSLDTMDDVHAMHGSSDGILTAVGGNLMSGGAGGFTGVAFHRALSEGE